MERQHNHGTGKASGTQSWFFLSVPPVRRGVASIEVNGRAIMFLCVAEHVFDRRSAVKHHRIFAAEHGVVKIDAQKGGLFRSVSVHPYLCWDTCKCDRRSWPNAAVQRHAACGASGATDDYARQYNGRAYKADRTTGIDVPYRRTTCLKRSANHLVAVGET